MNNLFMERAWFHCHCAKKSQRFRILKHPGRQVTALHVHHLSRRQDIVQHDNALCHKARTVMCYVEKEIK